MTSSTTCLCGLFQTIVQGSFGEVRYCHCSQCRKKSGTAFTANAKVAKDKWSLDGPEDEIREFEHAPGLFNAFCGRCGSPLYARSESDPSDIRIRIGGFDEIDVDMTGHVWLSSKANWYQVEDSLAQYSERYVDDKTDA